MSDAPIFLWVILLALSSARITHLVTTDSITQWFRDLWTYNPAIDELVHCPWCSSVWVGFGHATLLWWSDVPVVFFFVFAMAASYVAGWLETH